MQSEMQKEQNYLMQEKQKRWQKLCHQKFKKRKKNPEQFTNFQKDELPPELIRKIVKDHGNLSGRKFQKDKQIYLGAMKYLPHAIYKLLENMPMPWEETKYVKAVYHITGALTIVDEVPKVIEPVYKAQWATMWMAMKKEKIQRKNFKRMKLPPFDDEEPPMNYGDNIQDIEPLDPIQLELDEQQDNAVYDWLYDNKPLQDTQFVQSEAYKKYNLDLEKQKNLVKLSDQLHSQIKDKNYFYLFNKQSFLNGKALNQAIPGGPKFEPLYRDKDDQYNEEWNEFNDLDKCIFRHYIRTEYKIAFPYLYNNRPRQVVNQPNQYPYQVRIKPESSDENAFKYHKNLKPISLQQRKKKYTKINLKKLNENILQKKQKIDPILKNFELQQETTLSGIQLLYAPKQFKQKSGVTKRSIDISLIDELFKEKCPKEFPVKVRVSYQRLLKQWVWNKLHKKQNKYRNKKKLVKEFLKTKYFQRTEMDWLEAGLQLVRQAFNMMNLIIHKRNLTFLHLDYNFGLKPVKTLTTKERKKSRFGNAFHLLRELMRLTKMLVDAHARFRLGEIDAYELADGIQYIFSHVANVTGIYRYKYKVMKQVRMCKDLKHLIYYNFNNGINKKGPGCGFWQPQWRVWVFFMRGTIPILERWLGNLLARQFVGRHQRNEAKTITKQRVESNFDLELRSQIIKDVKDMMPETIKGNKAKIILQHLSEAWRCWKANIIWKVEGMPIQIENLIQKYVKLKANNWTNQARINRKKIREGILIDKTVCKKNVGRISRLFFKNEQQRQIAYLEQGPYLSTREAITLHSLLVDWLDERKFQHIPFPPFNYKHDIKIFVLALERLKEAFSVKSRLNQNQRDQLALIEMAYDNTHEALSRVKKQLLTQRTFKSVKIQFMDLYTHLFPIYELDPLEKITDSYLDQYLWYESNKRGLFPNWIKPADSEPAPLLAYKFCEGINNIQNIWDTSNGERVVIVQSQFERVFQKVDLTILNRLLRLCMEHNLADYMTSKNNVKIEFKDMLHVNGYGLLHGLNFSSFLIQFWGLILDLLLIGVQRAKDFAGPFDSPNDFMKFESDDIMHRHPLKAYCRYIDKFYAVFKFTQQEAEDLIERYLKENPDPLNENLLNYPTKKCWPKNQRMRLMKFDVNLGRAIFWELKNRLPQSLTTLDWDKSYVSVYSNKNPNLLFEMCGFEIRIQPKIKTDPEDFIIKDGVWKLINENSKQITALAHLQVGQEFQSKFENRIRQILMASGSTTFTKIVNKWNTSLIGFIIYFREAIVNSENVLDLLVKSENKIQNRIKMGINSKMPSRFPPCVFYSPKELGGLGMLSMGHILIPQADLLYSKQTNLKITHFRQGMSHEEDKLIPNLYRYVQTWESEFLDSKRVWSEYAIKRQQALIENQKLDIYDLEDSWDFGVPRIYTLFQKDRLTLAYDKGWRVRQEFKQYQVMKQNPFWWTHQRHDGKLWNLNNYRQDVIEALGGIEAILEHTLYKGTFYQSWEGLFWEKASGFEESMKYKKLTNAQRSGLNQIPNRRFTLWWSPTINRANVYIGYSVQLDLTGILMFGKLPTLKVSLLQIFRAHLWQKIHESLVLDYFKVLELQMDNLEIETVQKETIHPRKSYKLEFSCADLTLLSQYKWNISQPSLLHNEKDIYNNITTNKFWIDIQLRWGNYDQHNIERYARSKYLEYTTDQMSLYPSKAGILIAYDLCYNMYSAYGNWFPGLKQIILEASQKIMTQNPALFVIRERIRNALQLHSTEPTDSYLSSTNYSELFSGDETWIIDDSSVYRVVVYKTLEGNQSTRPVNGALFILNAKTGKLYVKIIHTSIWVGQKHRGQLAKWKAAEETAALIRSLPEEDHPKKIVVMRKSLLDPLEMQLLDFPNIVIKGSEIQVPFQSLLKMQQLGDFISKAQKPELLIYNLYDDWREHIQSFTCFNRSILIMRSLHVDILKTIMLLKDISKNIKNIQDNLWPYIEPDDWPQVEVEMRNLILSDFAKRCNVNVSQLTRSEVRDIILGLETAEETIQKKQMDDIKKQKNEAIGKIQTVTETINKEGEKIIVATTNPYEQEKIASRQDWRIKALSSVVLKIRSNNIQSAVVDAETNPFKNLEEISNFIIAENLIQKFVKISDLRTSICGYIFGNKVILDEDNNIYAYEIKVIQMLPQTQTNNQLQFPIKLSDVNDLIEDMSFLGWIKTQNMEAVNLSPQDLLQSTNIMRENKIQNFEEFVILNVSFPMGRVILSSFCLTKEGMDWGLSNQSQNIKDEKVLQNYNNTLYYKCPIWISQTFSGYFIVPDDQIWNYNFIGGKFDNNIRTFYYQVNEPKEFYNELHRVNHFINFSKGNQIENEDEFEDIIIN